jgi:3-oxoacyl-[acyl-carrier protein] reductase
MEFQDKTVLVTGSARGIGAACARRFAQAGAQVVVHYLHNAEAAEDVANSIRMMGGKAVVIQADLAQPTQIQQLVDTAIGAFGCLHILVNNAGICQIDSLTTIQPDHFYHQFAVNVGSVLFTTQATVRSLSKTGGSVINISSINGSRPVAGAAVYSATKAAVEALTKSLAIELAPQGIRVNAVAPGTTDTPLLRSALPPDREAVLADHTLYGRRLGRPDDIAEVVMFLASSKADWITGQVINASGGLQI